jgi:hypothetical protein
MRIALFQAIVFAASGLLLVIGFEVLTFELPPKGGSAIWEQRLSLHIALVAVLGFVALIGSFAGFMLPSAGRRASLKVAAAVGAIYVLLAALVAVPTALSVGLILGSLLALLLAVGLAWGASRGFGRNAA